MANNYLRANYGIKLGDLIAASTKDAGAAKDEAERRRLYEANKAAVDRILGDIDKITDFSSAKIRYTATKFAIESGNLDPTVAKKMLKDKQEMIVATANEAKRGLQDLNKMSEAAGLSPFVPEETITNSDQLNTFLANYANEMVGRFDEIGADPADPKSFDKINRAILHAGKLIVNTENERLKDKNEREIPYDDRDYRDLELPDGPKP